MIIPIRCFTCGNLLGHKWETFKKLAKEQDELKRKEKFTLDDITIDENKEDLHKYFDKNSYGKILDDMELVRYCCRRHIITHVDLIDII